MPDYNLAKTYNSMYANEAMPRSEFANEASNSKFTLEESRKRYSANIDELYDKIFNENLEELLNEGVAEKDPNEKLDSPLHLQEQDDNYIRINRKYLKFMVEKYAQEVEDEKKNEKALELAEQHTSESKEILTEDTSEKEVITETPKTQEEQRNDYITQLSEQLGAFVKKQKNNALHQSSNSIQEDVVVDPKYLQLEAQIHQLKKMIMENTVVHAVGQGQGPGSGEVNIAKMDDMAGMEVAQPGDSIVWNGAKFVPASLFAATGPQAVGAQGPQITPPKHTCVTVAFVAPSGAKEGDLWFDGYNLYVYYPDPASGTMEWVQTNP